MAINNKNWEQPHFESEYLIDELIFNKILAFHYNMEIHDILFICGLKSGPCVK